MSRSDTHKNERKSDYHVHEFIKGNGRKGNYNESASGLYNNTDFKQYERARAMYSNHLWRT